MPIIDNQGLTDEEMQVDPVDTLLNPESTLVDDVLGGSSSMSEGSIEDITRDVFALRRLQNPQEDVNSLWQRTDADVRNSPDPRSISTEERTFFGDNEYTQAMNIAMESVAQGDSSGMELAQDLIQNPNIYTENYAEGTNVITTLASTAPLSYPEYKKREEASQSEIFNTFSQWAEEQDKFDGTIDAITLILGADTAKDLNDLMGSGIVDSVGEFTTDLKRFHYTLTPEQREAEFKNIFPQIVEAFDGNEWKISAIVGMFLDKNLHATQADLAATAGLEGLLAVDAFRIVNSLAKMRKMRNLANTYKRAGKVDEAARATIVASIDDPTGASAKTVGMNRGEAAASTSPVELGDVIPNSIDGIAARVAEIKETVIKTIKDDLFGWSANKLPRSEEQALRGTKRDLVGQLRTAQAELKAVSDAAGGTKKSMAAKAKVRAALSEGVSDIEGKIKNIDDQIALQNKYATAEAELSRLQQGVYSPAVKAQVDEAVEAELDALRAEAQAKAEGKVVSEKPSEAPTATKEPTEGGGVVKTSGLSEEFLEELMGSTIGPMKAVVNTLLKPAILDEKTKARVIKDVEAKVQAQVQKEGSDFANARVTHSDDTGFKMEYEVDGTGEVYEHTWTRNDAGSWISENTDPATIRSWVNSGAGRFLFSPSRLLENLNAGLVDTITFSGQQSAVIRNTLGKVWKDAEEGLSTKEIELVDNLLFMGDEWAGTDGIGKVFTPIELLTGVESKLGHIALDGMDNSQNIMRSYYRKRAFYDELHNIRDVMTRRNLEVKGFKNLDYVVDGTQAQAIVKPMGKWSFGDAKDLDHVIDLATGKPPKDSLHQVKYLKFKQKDFEEAGYEVVELFEPIKMGGTEIKYGVVKQGDKTKIGGLPKRVLNYAPGYVPRIYHKGMYFVKNTNSDVNETLFAFNSRSEAEKYVNKLKAEQENVTGSEKIVPQIREDRAMNQDELLREQSVGFGGLYTGSRKRVPLMVKEGDDTFRPDRLSTSQATERYLINLSEAMPLNEFREFAMQEWMNTVNTLAKATDSGGGVRSFDGAIDIDSRYGAVLEQSRDYLKKSLNIPTKEERLTHGWMMGIANMMEGKKFLAKPRAFFIDHADTDITRQMKGYTFDLTMGWFNGRQLFIQAQNASLAASMYPQHALPAFVDMMKMRTLIHMPEEKLLEGAKHLGYDQDLVDSVIKFKRSGLEDAIVRTADFNPVRAGVGNSSYRAFTKAAKTGRVFYEEGELASRLMTWSIARRNLGKDAGAEALSKESTRMHMNLQAENAAWWQNAPVVGMATQFLQVQAKFLENVMPKVMGGSGRWTPREKAQALAGQMVLYGTGGVFIAEEVSAYLADLNGQSLDEWERENPNVAEAVQEGFVGSLLSVLGAGGINATEAVSLVAGFDDNVISDIIKAVMEMTYSGQKQGLDVTDLTFGPTMSTIRRSADAIEGMMNTVASLTEIPDDETFVAMLMNNADQVLSMTSTWNNVQKMKLLQKTELLLGKDGQKIATVDELGGLNPLEYMFIGFGFSTDAEVSHYRQKDFIKEVQKERTQVRKALMKNYKEYSRHGNEELFKLQRALIIKSSDLSNVELMDIDTSVIESIMGPSSVDTQAKQFLNELIKTQGRIKTAPGQSQLIEGN